MNGADIKLQALRISPLSGKLVDMRGLRIAPADNVTEPVVSVDKILCRWSPFNLFERQLRINLVEISGVRVQAEKKNGQWSVASLLPAGKGETKRRSRPPLNLTTIRMPTSIGIDDISVRDVLVEVKDADGHKVQLSGLWVFGSASWDRKLRGDARLSCGIKSAVGDFQIPKEARLETALGAQLRIKRDTKKHVTAKGKCKIIPLDARYEGTEFKYYPGVEGDLSAKLNIAELTLPNGRFQVRMGDLLHSDLKFAVNRDEKWELEGENTLAIELREFNLLVVHLLESFGGLESLKPGLELQNPALSGLFEMTTDIDATLISEADLGVRGSLVNRVELRGLNVRSGLTVEETPEKGTHLSGEIKGWDFTHRLEAEYSLDPQLSVKTTQNFHLNAPYLRCGFSDLATLTCRNIKFGGTVDSHLSDPVGSAVRANFGTEILAVKSKLFGRMAAPVHVALKLEGDNLADPQKNRIKLESLEASVGKVIPELRISGDMKGYGAKGLNLTAEASTDLGAALNLQEGLLPELRHPLEKIRIGGRTFGKIVLAGTIPNFDPDGRLRVKLDGGIELEGAGYEHDSIAANVKKCSGKAGVEFAVGKSYRSEKLDWFAESSIQGFRLASPVTVEMNEANFSMSGDVKGDRLGIVDGGIEGGLEGLSFAVPSTQSGQWIYKTGTLGISGSAALHSEYRDGNLRVENIDFRVPGIMTLKEAAFEIKEFGSKQLTAAGRISVPDVNGLKTFVPTGFQENIRELKGRIDLSGKVSGHLPLVNDFMASEEPNFPELRVFPLRNFYEQKVPLDVTAKFHAADIGIEYAIGPHVTAGFAEMNAQAAAELKEGQITGRVGISVPRVKSSLFSESLGDFAAGCELELKDFDSFRLRRAFFSGFDELVRGELQMGVEGLGKLREMPTPGQIVRRLDGNIEGNVSFKTRLVNALEDWNGWGKAQGQISVDLVRDQYLEINASVGLDDFGVRAEELFAIRGLESKVPFRKRWRILTPGEYARRRRMLSESVLKTNDQFQKDAIKFGDSWKFTGHSRAEDALVSPGKSVSADSISLFGRPLARKLAVRVQTQETGVRIPSLRAGLLGGTILARAGGWHEAQELHFHLTSEYGGIDIRQILPTEMHGLKGDSTMAGNLLAQIVLRKPGTVPARTNLVKQLSARLNITHIGSKTLSRILLFLDPEAENPSIVQIRQKLKLGSPRRAIFKLESGFFSIDIELQGIVGQFVSQYSVPRFEVSEIFGAKALERCRAQVEILSAARKPLRILAAELLIANSETGEIRFIR